MELKINIKTHHNRNHITEKRLYATNIVKIISQMFTNFLYFLFKIIRIRFKNPFHDIIRQFPSAVLVHDAFVVHRPRTAGKPLVTDADIAKLPDIDTSESLVFQDSRKLFFQRFRLVLLRPFGMVVIPETIDRTRTCL